MKKKNSVLAAAGGVVYGVIVTPCISNASGLEQITKGMNTIKTFITSAVAIIGAIIFVRNALDFGNAIQDRDRNGMVSGLLGMLGGAVIAAAGTIATIFGITA